MSIKFKLIISYLVLIIFTVGVLGLLIGKKAKNSIFTEVTEKSDRITEVINTTVSVRNDLLLEKAYSDINSVERQIKELGDISIHNNETVKVGNEKLPALYAGNSMLSLDNRLMDKMKEATGSIASLYLLNEDKLIRVSTTLLNGNQRALGSYIDKESIVYQKIVNNEEYSGVFEFNGERYISRIIPLVDKDNKVAGAIGVGNPVINKSLEKNINDIKVGKTGYVYILDDKGILRLHPKNKGKNASEYDYVKEMFLKKNGTIEYEYDGVRKQASYRYFEPWDWYIVATANYDDLNSSSKEILVTTLVSGGIIILLATLLALIMANNLVKPINKLKSYMEIAGAGDLTVRSEIDSKDEIGVLSNSFNNMIGENNRLLEETVKYDKLKTEFIANMSHELKTPLNIIFSTAQIFSLYINKTEGLNNRDKLGGYVDTMKQNCYRLLRLVNNLIDITKIDSGFMELNLKNENIVEVIEEITLSTAEYIESMDRNVIFDTDVEEKIMAFDEEKMERIILNLISNAIKFTGPGGLIEVSIYDKGDYIILSVKDNGRGIPEDKIEEVFERFKQVDQLLSRSHEGSGIGLSMVKSLVQMHDGTIEAKSKQGKGTELILRLPVKSVDNNDDLKIKKLVNHTNIEKIQIEFSDIYK